jgi:NADH-quinone oxidoreductase subunit C
MNNETILTRLRGRFPKAIINTVEFRGELSVYIAPGDLLAVAQFLRDEAGYEYLENLCGVDYLGRELRFEVVYHFLSFAPAHRLCLKVGLPEQNPTVPSLTGLWPTANWQERETYDLMGITFSDHPSLTRILMPDEWEGHPLRKDVPLGEEEIAFTFNQERIYAHKPFAKE